jgi:hypothetical protein
MASSSLANQVIKIEDSPEPLCIHSPTEVSAPPTTTPPAAPSIVVDPQDPEGFLRRCSGHNKKTRIRCSATIGKNARDTHPTFLPTCHAHKDQQSFAGWCQFMQKDNERCGRLFRWTPPYFELCEKHQGHPDTPCHFMALPLELRQEIFRYLLPTQPIGSSSSPLHQDLPPPPPQTFIHPMGPTSRRAGSRSMFQASPPADNRLFPYPIVNLFRISRRIHAEVKDLLYSSVPFTIDIRKDGTFMCGRRLLEPRRPDGSAHFTIDDAEKVAREFTNTFDFTAVKNYNVDIMVENCADEGRVGYHPNQSWDEEVEMYDIRGMSILFERSNFLLILKDYCGVVVSGILSKAQNLCRLNVRLGLSKFNWQEEELLANVKCLVEPFERLRNVRQPRLCGVFDGFTQPNFMVNVPLNLHPAVPAAPVNLNLSAPLCSVPRLPTNRSLIVPGDPKFEAYKQSWEKLVAKLSDSLPAKPPIRAMFTEFKQFYTKLSAIVPAVIQRHGKHAFLHRARVARENENVEAFRHLRNELIHYWYLYVENEEQRKKDMEAHMSRMLDSDIYPSSDMEIVSPQAFSGMGSDCMTVDADSGKGDRRCDKRKRFSRDAEPVHLGHSNFTEAGPSGTASPQQLQHNQSMALNPPRESVDTARARQNHVYAHAQAQAAQAHAQAARVHAQRAAQAHTHAMTQSSNQPQTDPSSILEMGIEESATQAQRSAFHPGILQPQAIMMPNMRDQQKMKLMARASDGMTSITSSQIPVHQLKRSSPSTSFGVSTATQDSDRDVTPFDPPEGWNDTWSKAWQDAASLAPMTFQTPQHRQQILQLQLMHQQQLQQAQQVQQAQLHQAELQQQYRYQQDPHSFTTTAHMTPRQPHQSSKDVIQDCMKNQSDSSATVSPMTAHSTIPSCGLGFIIQSNGNSGNEAFINDTYPHVQSTHNDSNYHYQMPAPDAAPSLKKRRIDSGISVGNETPIGHITPYEQDVILNHSVEQGGDINFNYNAQSSVPYVGKGKGRAIEVEEPMEVVWLD